jgi:hypothetical protein
MNSNSLPILLRAFAREYRSLAQYIGESWPWMDPDNREASELVRSIRADERRWVEQFADLIYQRGGMPLTGTYPTEFPELHFLSLDYLLLRLAEYLEHTIESLEQELALVGNDLPVRTLFQQMIERKQGQINALRQVAPTPARA